MVTTHLSARSSLQRTGFNRAWPLSHWPTLLFTRIYQYIDNNHTFNLFVSLWFFLSVILSLDLTICHLIDRKLAKSRTQLMHSSFKLILELMDTDTLIGNAKRNTSLNRNLEKLGCWILVRFFGLHMRLVSASNCNERKINESSLVRQLNFFLLTRVTYQKTMNLSSSSNF